MPVEVDILEDSIFQFSPELLNTLLKDHTTSRDEMQRNIFWATSLQIMNILAKNTNTIPLSSHTL